MISLLNAVKAINSEWDVVELAMSSDGKFRYRTFYIVSNGRYPKLAECQAIADFVGYKYNKGYFYWRIDG